MENNIQTSDQYEEIDLRELFSVLWAGKIKIIAITAVFAVASIIYALSVPNQYKATALLAPAQSDGGGLSGALGQLGGLASLAGIGGGSGQVSESKIAQEIMKSQSFIEKFITENDLSVTLMAVRAWDHETHSLVINEEAYDIQNKQWLSEGGIPNSWQLFQAFSGMLKISESKVTGLVTVSIEYYSPKIAKEILDSYITAVNAFMQERQITKVSRNIEYLQAQIQKTTIAQMKSIFYAIVESQIKTKMLAEASPDYAFTIISPTMEPVLKSKPSRAVICALITLFGAMVSVLLTLVMHYARKSD